jgi:hypothetical protein
VPEYTQAEFDAKLPGWTDIIVSGKKTPDRLIAFLQTKVSLTPAQIKKITNLNLVNQE